MVGRAEYGFEMLPSVIARVLYTRYCALELSTRIFAVIQRLACAVHILVARHPEVHDFRADGARKPNWKRVAIKRHEFHPKSEVAVATSRFADGTGSPSSAFSSSLRAAVGSVVVSTTSALRPIGGAPHDRSAFLASSGCLSSSATAFSLAASRPATSPRSGNPHLLPVPVCAQVSPYARLLEAV